MDHRISTTLVAASALLAFEPATAKAPDGFTPPKGHDVCADYHGRAYGLCVSYCEARDCDHPETRVAARACERAARMFEHTTGDPLPCEAACTSVDAGDDIYYIPGSEPGGPGDTFERDLFANDVTEPPGAELEVVWHDAPRIVDVTEDGFAYFYWPPLFTEQFPGAFFEYEACCDDEVCDTATVYAIGS